MPISPEEFRRNAKNKFEEGVARLRAIVEEKKQEAYDRGASSFSVSIPDSVTSDMQKQIINEYTAQGWAVNTGHFRNEGTMDFS